MGLIYDVLLKATGGSIALLVLGLFAYPRRRVLTWFEFATDSDSSDELANVVQELLWEWWQVLVKYRIHDPKGKVAAALAKEFRRLGTKTLVEICAGGGGASITWAKELRKQDLEASALLTDIHPDIAGWEERKAKFGDIVQYVKEPVDAMNIGKSEQLKDAKIRSINLALHHFPPDMAKMILADTVRTKGVLFVGDLAPNYMTVCLNWLTCMPVGLKMMAGGRIPFKHPLDVFNPFKGIHDATVSVLRAYSTEQLRELGKAVEGGENYEWTTFESESAMVMLFGSMANGLFPPLMHFSIFAPR